MAWPVVNKLFEGAASAGTTSGAAVAVWEYDRGAVAILSATRTAGTGALDVKLQASADGATWADMPSGAFAQATGASTSQAIVLSVLPAFLRAVVTVGATTTWQVSVSLSGRGAR